MITGVDIEAFCYPTENIEKVKQAFMTVSPVPPEITHATTHFGSNVSVLRARLSRKSEIRDFLHRLTSLPEADKDKLRAEIRSRVDDRGNFYIRFDKFRALDGELDITDSSDAIKVSIKFTTYPRSLDKAIEEIDELI